MSKIHIGKRKIQDAVKKAVAKFLKEEPRLLSLPAHEQAMSHRIAVYLEAFAHKHGKDVLMVDCEYNKHLGGDKIFDLTAIDPTEFESCGCHSCRDVKNGERPSEKCLRPDIVVHERGTDNNNQIAIEIKKDKLCSFDREKLKALTVPREKNGRYGYTVGVFVYFQKGEAVYKWFPED